jgi:hypothetical protein
LCPDGVTTAATEEDCPDVEATTQTCDDGSIISVEESCPEPTQTCDDGSVIAADEECPDTGTGEDETEGFTDETKGFTGDDEQIQQEDEQESEAEVSNEDGGESRDFSEGE